jgi:hypothetical protein
VQIVLAFLALGVLFVASLMMDISFPYFEHSREDLDQQCIPADSFDDISTGVSRFLWSYRGLDIISQSFVVLTAVICCLAMLKYERRHK